ncbi:MAG TPA: MarR family transcriptional regulator [Gaiellales bacterium]|nr:MarR family transcriptional regulator [Gaiellales bacterium]
MPDSDQIVSPDELAFAARFRVALHRFNAETETVVRECGLTTSRYVLLLIIQAEADAGREATVSTVAEQLQLSHNTVSELVSRATEAGLLHRERTPSDRRSSRLSLTEEGRRRLVNAVARLSGERAALGRIIRRRPAGRQGV